jgi:Rieske Fe-S protein
MTAPLTTRRTALFTIGGTTVAVCLAGCAAATGTGGGAGATSGPTTVKASEVPVGGGRIIGTYVVTQATAGTFAAFSYLCTHQGFPVQEVTTAAIVCGRHGSTFALADGSVITGPATNSLAKATVTVNGDTLTIS